MDRDLRSPGSITRKYARMLYEEAGRKARAMRCETWVKAVMFRFTKKKQLKESMSAWQDKEIENEIEQEFIEYILARCEALETSPDWRKVVLSETEEDRMDAFRQFFANRLEDFRKESLEKWRNTKGTFSYYYRRAQTVLRKSLPSVGWRLYEPKSRFYGPDGLRNPEKFDTEDSVLLGSIPLPSEGCAGAGKLFYSAHAVEFARWFYDRVKSLEAAEEELVVAVRNLVWWLCDRYNLLDQDEAWLNMDENRVRNDDGVQVPAAATELENLALMVCSRLSSREKNIILLKLRGRTHTEVAEELALSGPSHVSYCLKKIGKAVMMAQMECPAMCSAMDEDAVPCPADEFWDSLEDGLKEDFTKFIVRLCSKDIS